tara:strand:- start:425 stop:1090 length:666 start_codon:yes stop_codon:yes gene_type:complete
MNNAYRLVVFDWEGTLGDTLGKLIAFLKVESKKMDLPLVDEHLARTYLYQGLNIALKKIFPSITVEQEKELGQKLVLCHAKKSKSVYLIPGARKIVEAIYQNGYDVAIATNKSAASLLKDLTDSGLAKFITTTCSASQAPAKPCPQMLEEIMAFCGVAASETLMIGDTTSDIIMANQLGVDSFGVNFYHQAHEIQRLLDEGAKKVFEDYRDLARTLQLKNY